MYAVNVTIKVQNELAKKAIILALKDWSNDLFQNSFIVQMWVIHTMIGEELSTTNLSSIFQVHSPLVNMQSTSILTGQHGRLFTLLTM